MTELERLGDCDGDGDAGWSSVSDFGDTGLTLGCEPRLDCGRCDWGNPESTESHFRSELMLVSSGSHIRSGKNFSKDWSTLQEKTTMQNQDRK